MSRYTPEANRRSVAAFLGRNPGYVAAWRATPRGKIMRRLSDSRRLLAGTTDPAEADAIRGLIGFYESELARIEAEHQPEAESC